MDISLLKRLKRKNKMTDIKCENSNCDNMISMQELFDNIPLAPYYCDDCRLVLNQGYVSRRGK